MRQHILWRSCPSKGATSTCLVNLSTKVIKYEKPLHSTNGPTMSQCLWANLASGVLNLCKGVLLWRTILDCWQGMQVLTNFVASFRIPFHTNRWPINSLVTFTPRCAKEWTSSKMRKRSFCGTRIRGTLQDLSTQIHSLEQGIVTFSKHKKWVLSLIISFISESVCCSTAISSKSAVWKSPNTAPMSGGRLKQSATTFCFPSMWRTFDVNSETNCSCLNRLLEYSLWLENHKIASESQNRVLLENIENVLSLGI